MHDLYRHRLTAVRPLVQLVKALGKGVQVDLVVSSMPHATPTATWTLA